MSFSEYEGLLPWLVLALGAALLVGTALALVRPRAQTTDGELARPPVGRSLVMMAVGALAAVWAVASLVG